MALKLAWVDRESGVRLHSIPSQSRLSFAVNSVTSKCEENLNPVKGMSVTGKCSTNVGGSNTMVPTGTSSNGSGSGLDAWR